MQSVPKTFWQTSPNNILEEIFLFDLTKFMQYLLDWRLWEWFLVQTVMCPGTEEQTFYS